MPIIEFTDQDPPEILEEVRKIVEGGITLKEIEEEFDLKCCPKMLNAKATKLFYRRKIQEILKSVIKWAEDNHEHHEFADENITGGCVDKDMPYVNSLALVKYIEKLCE